MKFNIRLDKKVKENVGLLDRALRAVAGIALVVYGAHARSFVIVLGTFLLVTAIVGVDPLYLFMGLTTNRPGDKKRKHKKQGER